MTPILTFDWRSATADTLGFITFIAILFAIIDIMMNNRDAQWAGALIVVAVLGTIALGIIL